MVWNAGVTKWLKDDWHVTLVRAAMAVDKGGYLQNPGGEKAKLEAVVQGWFAQKYLDPWAS